VRQPEIDKKVLGIKEINGGELVGATPLLIMSVSESTNVQAPSTREAPNPKHQWLAPACQLLQNSGC